MNDLEKLLYLSGVSADYLDYSGNLRQVPWEDRLRVLQHIGYNTESADEVATAVFELDSAHWQQWLKPLQVTTLTAPGVTFYCAEAELERSLSWQLTRESGDRQDGHVIPSSCRETGEYFIAGNRYTARELPLPGLDAGYHQFALHAEDVDAQTTLVVCPPRCYGISDLDVAAVNTPVNAANVNAAIADQLAKNPTPNMAEQQKLWGISCQLYTLRSPRNWGIGDFADLQELIQLAAPQGVDLIGLNPLHICCSYSPDAASPYSPSDRRFINPVYISVDLLPEFQTSEAVRERCAEKAFSQQLTALRATALVDHPAVNQLKYQVLELIYAQFLADQQLSPEQLAAAEPPTTTSERGAAFLAFVTEGGDVLQQIARYEVINNRYARLHATDPWFYCFLQWLARSQLDQCQTSALAAGMKIGLMGDLAVGSIPSGCEVVANPQLYIAGVSIGAPPDPFSSEGQNWGLPVMNPVAIRQNNFRHFIDLLQANMHSVGALRVDHVMSLLRLWWCLPKVGEQPVTGVYVYYPLEELVAILCLESWRNRCMIIGEDLGVVPDAIRQVMGQQGIYGNDLFYFTQWWDGRFKDPHEQRPEALLSITNHDVPTLADWWSGDDIHRRFTLGVIQDEADFHAVTEQRNRDRIAMLQWLQTANALPPGWVVGDNMEIDSTTGESRPKAFDFNLCESIHRVCARSQSRLLLLQLEDMQLLKLPVNIPATSREYPNWRRKQDRDTHTILAAQPVQQLFSDISEIRQQ